MSTSMTVEKVWDTLLQWQCHNERFLHGVLSPKQDLSNNNYNFREYSVGVDVTAVSVNVPTAPGGFSSKSSGDFR